MRMKMTKIAIVICVIVITIVMAISAARIVIAASQKSGNPIITLLKPLLNSTKAP